MIKPILISRVLVPSIAFAVLASCGGGGGGNPPSGTSNQAPVLSLNNGAPSFQENQSGTVITVSGSDPDGDQVQFGIAGNDAGPFVINQSGNLSFRQPPDFERPEDADRDNIYQFELTLNDGTVTTRRAITVEVTNDKEGINLVRIATGFVDPVGLAFLQSIGPSGFVAAGKFALAEKAGTVFEVDGTTGQRTVLANVFEGRPSGEVRELTFYGKGANNLGSGLYVAAQEPDGRVFLQRYTRAPIREVELLPSGSEAVAVSLIEGPNLGSGPGFFMATSDEDGTRAQILTSPFGKLFLLEPSDPFAGASVQRLTYTPTIIGQGLRRPGGGGSINNQILLSDQGGSLEHEMTFLQPDFRPIDFGWPGREGSQGIGSSPPASVNGPTIVYPVGTGVDGGTGVIFGSVYNGPIAELDGKFIFGDKTGLIWAVRFSDLTSGFLIRPTEMERRTKDFEPDQGQLESPISFVTDDEGRLFILDADGDLFRLDAA